MYRMTIKNLWAHKLRFALTGVAVVLGVAFMAGTLVLTQTMNKSFNNLVATGNQGIDVIVQQPATQSGQHSEIRQRVPATTLDTIKHVDGVDAAAGTVMGFAQIVQPDGKVKKDQGFSASLGTNWVEDQRLNPATINAGHAPRGPDEVVVDKGTFERDHRQLGDKVTVLSQAAPRELTLVGTVSYPPLEAVPGASLVVVDDMTAQQLFGQAGEYDTVAVAAKEGVNATELATSIDNTLGAKTFEVVTAQADTASKQAKLEKDLSFFNTFLLAFAYVALFVGMFIIYNTFGIVVAQRTKDMAMLRAIGTSRRQVLGSVVFESLIVGVFASAIGLGVGVLLSYGLRAMLDAVGIAIPSGELVLSMGTVVTAMVVGLTITVLSAVAPAVRASRIKPIAALRDVSVDRSGSSTTRIVAGSLITLAGAAAFAAGVTSTSSSGVQLVGLGSVATVIGVFVLGPVLARPVVRLLGWPVRRISGAAGKLATANAIRNPKRTAASATALLIGVTLVGFITIVAFSSKSSAGASIDRTFRADYIIDSGQFGTGGLSPAIEQQLTSTPGVAAVTPVRVSPVEINGSGNTVVAVDMKTIDQMHDLKIVAGSAADVTGNGTALEKKEAEAKGVTLGSDVTFKYAKTGVMPMKVVALYEEPVAGADESKYLVDLSTYQANVADQFDRKVYVKSAPGVSPEAGRQAIEGTLKTYPNAELQDAAALKAQIAKQIDQILNLVYGLLALAVLIALIGIANTLALSIHERTREIGLLRAVGMSRRQIRSTVRWESVLIALLGTVAGMGLAILGSWGVIHALANQGIGTFQLPVTQLVWITGLAAVAGVVAATGPARRAAKLDVLDAISAD